MKICEVCCLQRALAGHLTLQYIQEALEFGSYTDATDVYSFGVLLWELYHSQTSYKKTNAGFYIRPHMFPKFDEGAWLPYAALTVACLQEDPSRRYVLR